MINISEEDIKTLEREIDDLKKDIIIKEGVLSFLKDKGLSSLSTGLGKVNEQPNLGDIIDLSEVELDIPKKRSSTDDVWDVVSRFGVQEFTVAAVEAVLNKNGVAIDAINPRASIAGALNRLVKSGKVERTFEGSGNIPHRFQLASKGDSKQEVEQSQKEENAGEEDFSSLV